MQGSSQRSSTSRGPAMYYGYCHRSRQYRMMDLPDYVSNTQEGFNNLMCGNTGAYQGVTAYDIVPGYQGASGSGTEMLIRRPSHRDCGCGHGDGHHDRGCHCECCVNDADILVHARCGELRRIPLTFDNDARREKSVTLELSKFVTHGGKDPGWAAELTETQFTLRPCEEHTVSLRVLVRCAADSTDKPSQPPSNNAPGTTANQPAGTATTGDKAQATTINRDVSALDFASIDRIGGKVDRCQVAYATIRAEGALIRPILVAVAVLPEDCDSFRHGRGCGCCH
jgi:hypothetical protein